jgi:hypothetical protein
MNHQKFKQIRNVAVSVYGRMKNSDIWFSLGTTVLTQIASNVHARHLIRTSQPQQQPLCGGHLIPIHPLTSI